MLSPLSVTDDYIIPAVSVSCVGAGRWCVLQAKWLSQGFQMESYGMLFQSKLFLSIDTLYARILNNFMCLFFVHNLGLSVTKRGFRIKLSTSFQTEYVY